MHKARHSLLTRCCPDIFHFDGEFKINESEMMEDINYPFSSNEFKADQKTQLFIADRNAEDVSKYFGQSHQ